MRVTSLRPLTTFAVITLVTVIGVGSIVAINGCANAQEEGHRIYKKSDNVALLPQQEKETVDVSRKVTVSDAKHGDATYASPVNDAKRLDIFTITKFDLRLKEQCRGILGLEVRYAGPLNRSGLGQLAEDSIEDYLGWQIVGRSGLVVCRLRVSLEKSEATLVICDIEGCKLHISVDYVSDPDLRSLVDIDTPIREVSCMTIRELLKPLEVN